VTLVLGYIAAVLTTVAFLPQVLHSHRARRLEGISMWMLSLFTSGVVLWLAYGILIDSYPVIFANVVTVVLTGYLLYLKLRESREDADSA
jgi:MtN3 and saliva related transmembrane protein